MTVAHKHKRAHLNTDSNVSIYKQTQAWLFTCKQIQCFRDDFHAQLLLIPYYTPSLRCMYPKLTSTQCRQWIKQIQTLYSATAHMLKLEHKKIIFVINSNRQKCDHDQFVTAAANMTHILYIETVVFSVKIIQ